MANLSHILIHSKAIGHCIQPTEGEMQHKVLLWTKSKTVALAMKIFSTINTETPPLSLSSCSLNSNYKSDKENSTTVNGTVERILSKQI